MLPMSTFAHTITQNKYAHEKGGIKEDWKGIARRVVNEVVSPYLPELVGPLTKLVEDRKFMPGGRYLYAAGRKYPQVNSCFLLTVEDTREGWGGLMNRITNSLMTGGGIGVVYSRLRGEGSTISGMGGKSTGPCALMQMVNESGRHIVQGGSRRSAIWAGLHWNHPDVFKFINIKNWDEHTREGKRQNFNFSAALDMTNISVILDTDFFTAYNDTTSRDYELSHRVYDACIRGMCVSGEPGFSVDAWENEGENLRNAPIHGDTNIMTDKGYQRVADIVEKEIRVWTGKQWATTIFKLTRKDDPTVKVLMSNGRYIRCSLDHEFILTSHRRYAADQLRTGDSLLVCTPVGYTSPVYVVSVTKDTNSDVYCCDVGVDEHSFQAEGVIISNCTEVTTADDNDMCNLGSINLANIESLEEMRQTVELATAFLICGTIYSKLPLEEMYKVREKNRRLGLGLMGLHEWLLKRGKRYGPDEELGDWLSEYKRSGSYANRYADKLAISRPVATRSIAPNGTISIIAETTSGCEPIFAVAMKRRYLVGTNWMAQYIVDPTAHRLIQSGIPEETVEDALSLSSDIERRVKFQSWLQGYVDHGISSTINLPPWGSPLNNEDTLKSFGDTLMKYLPTLRGITAYPDGARDGQPLTKVSYSEAIKSLGVEFEDGAETNCKGGMCGV